MKTLMELFENMKKMGEKLDENEKNDFRTLELLERNEKNDKETLDLLKSSHLKC